jgi:hypothetical protein
VRAAFRMVRNVHERLIAMPAERLARSSPRVRLLRRAMLSHVARRIRTTGAGSAPT